MDPKKVEAGKRLQAYNKRAREALERETKREAEGAELNTIKPPRCGYNYNHSNLFNCCRFNSIRFINAIFR